MVTEIEQARGTELIAVRKRVKKLIRDISDLLEEIAEAEVDSFSRLSLLPSGSVGDRVAELVCQLQLQFTIERDDRHPRTAAANLDVAHDALLAQIDRVFELVRPPLRPASTWSDIESNFRRFVTQLNDYGMKKDASLQRITTGQVAVAE